MFFLLSAFSTVYLYTIISCYSIDCWDNLISFLWYEVFLTILTLNLQCFLLTWSLHHSVWTSCWSTVFGHSCCFFFYSCIATNYIITQQGLKQLFFLVRHRHTSRVCILRWVLVERWVFLWILLQSKAVYFLEWIINE